MIDKIKTWITSMMPSVTSIFKALLGPLGTVIASLVAIIFYQRAKQESTNEELATEKAKEGIAITEGKIEASDEKTNTDSANYESLKQQLLGGYQSDAKEGLSNASGSGGQGDNGSKTGNSA